MSNINKMIEKRSLELAKLKGAIRNNIRDMESKGRDGELLYLYQGGALSFASGYMPNVTAEELFEIVQELREELNKE